MSENNIREMIDKLTENAEKALHEYMKLDQEQVNNIVKAMAVAGLEHHRELAKVAIEATRKRSIRR